MSQKVILLNARDFQNTHVADTFIKPLDTFLKETIGPLKVCLLKLRQSKDDTQLISNQELRKKFEKSNDDVDSALSKYMSKKAKDPTLQEVS